MKIITLAIASILFMSMISQDSKEKTIFDFKVKALDGTEFNMSDLKGQRVMIVNTASECGLTPQYEQLQELYQTYKKANFIIIAFPSNDFGAQEPGSSNEIAAFCKKNYGVTFPVMEKIVVKGKDKHPLYKYLTMKSENGILDNEVSWNFQKYLIGKDGKLVKMIDPRVLPNDTQIIDWIESDH